MKFRVNQATKYCSLLLFLLTSILGHGNVFFELVYWIGLNSNDRSFLRQLLFALLNDS